MIGAIPNPTKKVVIDITNRKSLGKIVIKEF